MLLPRLLIAPVALCLSGGLLFGQVVTEDIGGPEGLDIYDELTTGEGTGRDDGASVWDVNDSLTFIPGYDMYCHWNTDVLFDRLSSKPFHHDTLRIELGMHECDIAMPCDG